MVRSLPDTVRITVFVITIALSLILPLSTGSVSAQQADEPAPFDMNMDNDGNGIPDDFERAYGDLARNPGPSAMDRFVARIPVSQDTLRLKGQIDTIFQTLQTTSSSARQKALLEQVQNLADQMVSDDPVHAAALRYLGMLDTQSIPASAGTGGGGGASTDSQQDYEDRINQRGDVLFIRLRAYPITPAARYVI